MNFQTEMDKLYNEIQDKLANGISTPSGLSVRFFSGHLNPKGKRRLRLEIKH